MENTLIQQSMAEFYQDLRQISLPEDAVMLATNDLSETLAQRGDNRPLLLTHPPQVKAEVFFNIMRQTAGIIKKHMPEKSIALDLIESALPEEPARRADLASKVFIPGTNLAHLFHKDLPADTLGLLLNHTVKLFMKQYVKKMLPFREQHQWHKGNCPICGGLPNFSILKKGNKGRYLHCGYCEITWRFKRLGCPFCNSNESQYLFIEGEEKYRVYICEKCHGYIKTIDGDKAGDEEVNLFMEDVSTLHLDLLAIKEGYYNKQPGMTNNAV